jgi:hypothetical protein
MHLVQMIRVGNSYVLAIKGGILAEIVPKLALHFTLLVLWYAWKYYDHIVCAILAASPGAVCHSTLAS